jgi:hypothetical protein
MQYAHEYAKSKQATVMSNSETLVQHTQHAFLVAWGWFAEHLGLIQPLQAVCLRQKHYHHRPQTKVLEFLVAILAGLQHLQDISLAAHPLDKDQAVAHAWEPVAPGWRPDRHSRFQYQPNLSPCRLWAYG